MKKQLLFLLTFTCLLFDSCTPLEKINLQEESPLVRLSRGACFGRCPIYNFTVYESGIAIFAGERFTPKLGTWIRELPDSDMRKLRDQLQETNLWQYAPSYPSRLSDAPQISITQYEGDAQKTVTGKDGRPAPILMLQDMLERLAQTDKEEWTVRQAFDYGLPEGATPGEIFVQLSPNVYARNWVQRYARQGLRIAEPLPERSNFYRMTFDPTVAFPREIERYLAYDEAVVDYSFLEPKEQK